MNDFKVQRNIVFKSVDGVDLKGDLFLPQVKGLKPAVIVVHGGGWTRRSGDMTGICKELASNGYVVFNATYRLAPKNLFPKALEDISDAVKWLKDHAKTYQVNPDKIAGWGYSAGAHLILLVGLDPELGLKAIVAGGTPSDLTLWPRSPLVKKFLGTTLKKNPTLWRQASPVYHVHNQSPPVFLYHGAWDKIVDIGQMYKMRDALLAKNRVVETYVMPYLGHFTAYFFSKKSIDQGIAFIAGYLNK